MLHPAQFQVDEAWIVFQLNDAPISTEQDGDFNFVALMDAASCSILGTATVPSTNAELSRAESRQLLEQGHARKQRWALTLFICADRPALHLSAEAEQQGITVVRVPEDQLIVFIGEARTSFKEHFGRTRRL